MQRALVAVLCMVIQSCCYLEALLSPGVPPWIPIWPAEAEGRGLVGFEGQPGSGAGTPARVLWPQLVARPHPLQKGRELGLMLRRQGGGLVNAEFTPLDGVNIMRYTCKMTEGARCL